MTFRIFFGAVVLGSVFGCGPGGDGDGSGSSGSGAQGGGGATSGGTAGSAGAGAVSSGGTPNGGLSGDAGGTFTGGTSGSGATANSSGGSLSGGTTSGGTANANGGTSDGGTSNGESGGGENNGSGATASGGFASGGVSDVGGNNGGPSEGGSFGNGSGGFDTGAGGAEPGGDPVCDPGYGLDASGNCALEPVPTGACAFLGADTGAEIVAHGAPVGDLRFDVFTETELGEISPYIYGTTEAFEVADNKQTILRLGGSRVTAYNWENNASNGGVDWYFQNDASMGWSNEPASGLMPFVNQATQNGAAAVLTLPLVDYVAADKLGGGDVRNSGPDYLTTRFKKNLPQKSAPLAYTPDSTDDSVYQDEFVSHMKTAAPSANLMFALDNEPELWSQIHPEVHPEPLTYVEIVQRNIAFAKSVKSVWPEAPVLGFGSYGWLGYITLQNAPDAAEHGDFIEYYLEEMAAAEDEAGMRLVDYLDLHWYPEASGGGTRIVSTAGDEVANAPEVVAARMQAPRSLWDEEYIETSWITAVWPEPIRLLPRLQEKIDSRYPGTKLAFTEWNYGGSGVISGAIATADVLGIFGCFGVGVATEWRIQSDESYFYAALRAFRNYDGQGGAFGDVSLRAGTSNYETSSVYASRDSAGRIVVMALNKLPTPQSTAIVLNSALDLRHADVFALTDAAPEVLSAGTLDAASAGSFSYEMPGYSVSVLVLSE